jgi:hypothetical protein
MTGWLVAAVLVALGSWLSRALGRAQSDLRDAQARLKRMEAMGDVATMDDRAVMARFMRGVRENGLPTSTEPDDGPDRDASG